MLMRLCLVILLLLSCAAHASEPELLEPEKAFRFSARLIDTNQVEIRYEIAPGYYLYRNKFNFSSEPAYVAFDASQLPPLAEPSAESVSLPPLLLASEPAPAPA